MKRAASKLLLAIVLFCVLDFLMKPLPCLSKNPLERKSSNEGGVSEDTKPEFNPDEAIEQKTHFLDQCRTKANIEFIQPYDTDWRQRKLPLLGSVVWSRASGTHDGEATGAPYGWIVSFSLFPQTLNIRYENLHRFTEWSSPGRWKCDGEDAVVIADGCPYGSSISIRCPQGKEEGVDIVTIYNYSYSVKAHVACERDFPLKGPAPGSELVGTAMLFGDHARNPRMMIEWVEYHRLIGFEHFFLYYMDSVNFSDPASANFFPQLPYISYVPYQMMAKVYERNIENFMYQTTQQMDALYRARAEHVHWIAFNDLDEYLQVGTSNPEKAFAPEKYMQPGFSAGLSVATWTFGNSDDADNRINHHNLIIDFIWRASIPFPHGRRQKCIVRVDSVDYIYIHVVSLGGKTVDVDPHRLRLNHYKLPKRGIWMHTLPNSTTAVMDKSLWEVFHTPLAKHVNATYTKWEKAKQLSASSLE